MSHGKNKKLSFCVYVLFKDSKRRAAPFDEPAIHLHTDEGARSPGVGRCWMLFQGNMS